MAEKSTIARPYAQAIFELARDKGNMPAWSEALQVLSGIMAVDQMAALAGNTSVKRGDIADIIIEVGGKAFDAEMQNMVRVLADNRRLNVAANIQEQYEVLRAEAENVIQAEMTSARDVPGEVHDSIVKALEKRLGRKVQLEVTIDESLIGGAVVKAGDLVIDGSAAGRLEKLTTAMI